MLDAHWPEFDRFVAREARPGDLACVPMPGGELRNPRYAWTLGSVDEVHHFAAFTALRGGFTRAIANQDAARQRTMLAWDRTLAEAMAGRLDRRVTRVVVSQNLLPFLWAAGHLQGRRFDVLMTRHSIAELQRRLDGADADALHRALRAALDGARHHVEPRRQSTTIRLSTLKV